MASQTCSFGLRSGQLGGQGTYWNSYLCFSKHSSPINLRIRQIRTSATQSCFQQYPLNCVFGSIYTRLCIILVYQLSHYLVPIYFYHVGQSLMPFFYDTCTSNALASTAGFIVIYPLFINTNNSRSGTTYQSCSFRDTHS